MVKINITPEIKTVKLKNLIPAPYNPREISEEALRGLNTSLQKFGYIDLLIVNKKNMHIVSGNQRYKLLLKNNIKEASVIFVELDNAREKALCLTMNNKNITGSYTDIVMDLIEEIKKSLPQEDFIALQIEQIQSDIQDFKFENINLADTPPPQKEENSFLKLTFAFNNLEEKAKFIEIIEHFGDNQGLGVNDKIHSFITNLYREIKRKS